MRSRVKLGACMIPPAVAQDADDDDDVELVEDVDKLPSPFL